MALPGRPFRRPGRAVLRSCGARCTLTSQNPSVAKEPTGHFSRVLRRADVFLLGVVATFNLNLVPTLAASGWAMPLLMLAAVLTFVVPQAVAVVELNRKHPGEGGMAEWVRGHFGDFWGFLTAWCYWANNVVYVPTLLVFLVGNLQYLLVGATDEKSKQSLFVFAACLVGLWLVVGLCILGFGVSRWLSNAGGIGMLLALVILLVLCSWSLLNGPLVLPPASATRAFDWKMLAAFGVFCLALVGPELSTIVGDEIRESTKVVPWSVWRVAFLAVVCYFLGAAVLQISLPAETIHSVEGVLAAGDSIGRGAGAGWVVAPLGWLMCVSVAGAAVAWFAGASRMLWVAAHDGSLPPVFARLSPRFGTPVLALLVQGVLSSVILAASFMGANAKQVFITLVDLTVVLQLIPFLTMFAGLLRAALVDRGPRTPWFAAAGLAGMFSSAAGIALAFVPSRHVDSVWAYELNLSAGCVLFLGSCVLIFALRRSWQGVAR